MALFVVTAGRSEAKAASKTHGTLMHAFTPHRDSVTGELIARVDNTTQDHFQGWVCATEKANGKNYHLGCLQVHLGPAWSNDWSFQFGVRTKHGGSVSYSYSTGDKRWHPVLAAL